MRKVVLYIVIALCTILKAWEAEAQSNKGIIDGQILAAQGKVALEYVNIALYHTAKDSLMAGTISHADGTFKLAGLAPGTYYLDISFIGYASQRISDMVITSKKQHIHLGPILLGENSENLREVEVISQRTALEFKLDKKVIIADKHYTSISGSAVNVLGNIPSIVVDIEGNVTLRGSTSFSVLVDGIPSILEPSEALQQIPASSIDKIEIITNPSAKYNPDGTSGIIHIITKKNSANGLSGVYNLKAGTNNAAGDFQFNLKQKKISYFFAADYYLGDYTGEKNGYRNTYAEDSIFSIDHQGDIRNKFDRYHIKGGVNLTIDSLKSLHLNMAYGSNRNWDDADLFYSEYDNYTPGTYAYISDEDAYHGSNGLSANAFYTQRFKTKDQELSAMVNYQQRASNEYSKNRLRSMDLDQSIIEGKKNTEEGPMERLLAKLDYTQPLSKYSKIESGYQSTFYNSEDQTDLLEFQTSSAQFISNSLDHNQIKFHQDIHALYLIYSHQTAHLSYQIGIRGEYTSRTVDALPSSSLAIIGDTQTSLHRYDYFPSLHLSYKLASHQELMASYARKIERASSYHYEPFYTWVDAYNIRHGNSSLLPEYSDSYELNYLKKMEKAYLSIEGYYSTTNNKIEWIRSVYDDHIIQRYPENVGKDYYLGLDLSYSFDMLNWWRIDLSGSVFDYRVKGQWQNDRFDEQQLTWNYRINQTLKLNTLTQLQANWRYYSKRITSQGVYQPVYTFDMALRKEFLKRKLTVVAELRDIFSTNNRENTNTEIDFKDHYFQKIHTPVLTFVLTYRFNNYKPNNKTGNNNELNNDESME